MAWTLIALALALQEPLFAEDTWESWNAFAVGSSVTLEIEVVGREPKTKTTVTLKSKSADKLVLSSSGEGDEDETVEKPPDKPAPPDPTTKCVLCGKHVAAEYKQTKEKAKVGDKELECVVLELKTYDCKSVVSFHQRTWYSKDVPGWRVRVETEIPGIPKSIVACVSYTKK